MGPTTDTSCIFVTDLHGSMARYRRLIRLIEEETPSAVFVGGDILPSILRSSDLESFAEKFIDDFLAPELRSLRIRLGKRYPSVFLILGNDDPRAAERDILREEYATLWQYAHNRHLRFGEFNVYGYSYVPPSPFFLKDWERYDVSQSIDPGCISPEEGMYSVEVDRHAIKYATIRSDLEELVAGHDLSHSILLFHAPPYQTALDRAALDGRMVDHVPMDVHVGSIAIRRLIEQKHPLLTLHGHVHESSRLTGSWRDRIGDTHMLAAGHDGPELAVVRFRLDDLESATRELLSVA
jgi:Icc-related predicted phosphoesterase